MNHDHLTSSAAAPTLRPARGHRGGRLARLRLGLLGALFCLLPLARPAAAPAKPAAAASPPATVVAPAAPVARGPNGPVPIEQTPSPFVGEPFFLLSDTSFGSQEMAKVRVEVNSPYAFAENGGLDVVLYRVPDPLEFLARQPNLHRLQLEARAAPPPLAQALTHLWDNWVVKARLAWRQIFASGARKAVTQQTPELATSKALTKPTTFEQPIQFAPLPGLQVVDRFRYPLQAAQPIKPLQDVKLAGSSSEFVRPSPGNLHLPLGQRPPGLYVVEALAGRHRAQTLVFVADTVALTKVSSQQLMVWTAQRRQGTAVPRSRVVWTDGVGVLGRAQADELGVARLDRAVPELSFVFGEDPQGGVFISENFYYDSEIYAAKVYAVTDRPLYRPGDRVNLTVSGREFVDARESRALPDAAVRLSVFDPAGQLVHVDDHLRFVAGKGLDTRFQLPDNATGGGYEIRVDMGSHAYGAAFRVAEYQKPHFEIQLVPDKADFKTGEAITGQLQLSYPDGKPVTGAQISLSGRAQQLTMVDGELGYAQALPLKLDQQEIVSDARGQARFRLPPSEQPSRLVLSALATDGAAWRVRVTRELLVERGSSSWSLRAPRQFSAPGEAISFRLEANARSGEGLDSSAPLRPASWEWIRLENRSRASGPVSADNLALTFSQSGSYSLLLKDAAGRVVGAGHHWVSGAGLVAPAGHIQIVTDKPRYRSGETASVLISFPEAVDQALLTLERDRVEAVGLLGRPAAWLKAERLGPTQWRLAVPVKEEMSPNMTFSVAYVRNGDYVFQNAGLLVEQPRIEVAMRTDKAVYGPGETVQVDVDTRLAGQPVAAEVAVGVVDEMIYVLQPEIAPSIDEFFFHPRRNNVRTSASLSFIGYDVATGKLGQLPARRATGNQRAIKLLERPRRDDIDTAAWQPRLQTDAQGHARFSFVMPDALTRWRITGRAMDTRGRVGQQLAWLRSDKSFYAKWTAPDWLRSGDQAQATLALFNQTGKPAAVQWQARVGAQGPVLAGALAQLQPGINHVQVALPAGSPGGLRLLTTLSQGGTEVDRLETAVQRLPATWLSPRALRIDLASGSAALALPPDASRLQVSLSQDPAAALFSQRLDELIDYPWGCVEQTASRLLPLGLALQSLGPGQEALRPNLQQRLATARLRLAQMAGPKASFGWWGLGTDADAFLTLYAYYADARALQALGAPLPPGHGPQMLEGYARGQSDLSRLQRALALGWMQELGLPTASLVMSLAEELAHSSGRPMPAQRRASLVLTQDGHDLATVVVDRLVRSGRRAEAGDEDSYTRATLDDLGRAAEAAARRLQDQPQILARAGLLWSGRQPATPAALADWLERASADQPTIDRAQALVWLQQVAGQRAAPAQAATPDLPAPWRRAPSPTGNVRWQWPAGEALPQRLELAGGARAAWAWLSFDSVSPAAPTLPVQIERSLWRVITLPQAGAGSRPVPSCDVPGSACGALDPGRMQVRLERVEPGSPVDTRSLYLDRIEVLSQRDMRRVLTEVALPPGAQVESTTWGLDLEETRQPLEAARHQPHARGYALPIDQLDAGRPQVFRHLVRFSQRGRFVLPAARLHRMYDPEAVAVESSAAWPQVDVR